MKSFIIKYKIQIIVLTPFLFYFIFIFFDDNSSIKKMLKNQKYTVGIISSKYHYKTTWKPPGTDFIYRVNLKKYEGLVSRTSFNVIGEKYLVIFDSTKITKSSNLIPFYSLPDSIESPPNGWRYDEVPIPIDSVRIRKYVLGKE